MEPTWATPWPGNPTIAPYDEALHGVNQPANIAFVQILWASLGLLVAIIICINLALLLMHSKRRAIITEAPVECSQDGWLRPAFNWVPTLKQRFLYAPLFKYRRARRLRLWGTLPSRPFATFLAFFTASNIAYMLAVDFGNPNKYSLLAEIRGRTGTLAVANMVPLVLLIGRNNPLNHWMRLKYDESIMLHRWIGRIIVFEAVLHGIAWAVVHVADQGWTGVGKEIKGDYFILTGILGWLAIVLILFLSIPPLRSACYEAFLDVHIILAAVIIAASIAHLKLSGFDLPQFQWVIAAAALWGLERILRVSRLIAYSFSWDGKASAVVETLPGQTDVCRITMQLPHRVDIRPGSHAYVRLAAARPWETHPFSIAWVNHRQTCPSRKSIQSLVSLDSLISLEEQRKKTAVSFIVCAQRGFTRSLFNRVTAAGRPLKTSATFEGPYDGHSSLASYGHVVLIAGATGITHQLSYAQRLVHKNNTLTAAARRIVLIWVIRTHDSLDWIRPWLAEILSLPNCSVLLEVKIFMTRERPQESYEIKIGSSAPENNVSYFFERPNIRSLVEREVEDQIGAMFVSVCGPGGLSDDVRAAVRGCQSSGQEIDFEENGFSW
ncbi:Ferric reductase transmembrane component 3-like protein 1 [Colletotrichum chlorophyti]|uniref:ferric-chelate reductase (NADPH) n=1 Tax=Colletotrichum chlorophyti TaxID=708187 RepID=A0A1Q8S828_9PEZI|nr:Ferric reductase transmembrane component 3-like protein 1 [Colletotrichum chlorophyti]